MATDWSEEAKAKRSAAAKKAAETRKANREKKFDQLIDEVVAEAKAAEAKANYPYITNSRVARWALSSVSLIAMMRGARRVRWGDRTALMKLSTVQYAARFNHKLT